ncbi:helix-turn-helix domain-containing protein [uncultured Winogradskyella sp.]|uniref:helix-turn-helix domain-containing protein n=1 Tax=uncultured Winogradskyella sp. TaxID=395353 RepID=UPI002608DA0C|nr:helix-turn-helix domain-containing protein [uncultured Winogradskyella sp.]
MWINGPLLFTIGPFFYLHVKRKVTWKEIIHFIPFIIVFIWILPFYIKSPSEKLDIIKSIYVSGQRPETEIMQYLYVFHIGIYCLLGYFILKRKSVLFSSYDSDDTQHKLNKRSLNLYLLISIISLISFLICLIAHFYGVYYGLVDKFTISLLVLLVLLLQVYFTFKGYDEKLEIEFDSLPKQKLNNNHVLKTEEFKNLMLDLNELMETKKLYRNPNLKIISVAEELNVSMHQLSAAINQQNGNNFFDYINKLRIEELKTTLLDGSKKNLTLFAIARESGFKSNSSFYRVFKKYVGDTPKQFIKKNKTT